MTYEMVYTFFLIILKTYKFICFFFFQFFLVHDFQEFYGKNIFQSKNVFYSNNLTKMKNFDTNLFFLQIFMQSMKTNVSELGVGWMNVRAG